MPHYRLYFIDAAGSIASVEEFSARDDVEAIRLTRDSGAPLPRELWCRARIVDEVKPAERRKGSAGLTSADMPIQGFLNRINR